MRFPDFLVIGAMKSGTTTLWADLCGHPGLYVPKEKEPSNLCRAEVLQSKERRRYARLFIRAKHDQLCGEASTYYTMLPDISGVPERAFEICGSRLKLIYIMRNPIERAISHHWHSFVAGDMPKNINKAIREDQRLINYSLYARQLKPWIEMFGASSVHFIKMEDYIVHRQDKFNEVCRFIGVPSHEILSRNIRTAHNSKSDLIRMSRVGKWISGSPFYRTALRPLLTQTARRKARIFLGRSISEQIEAPSLETLQAIAASVRPDCNLLAKWVGFPLWDLDATVENLSGSSLEQSHRELVR